MRVEHEQDMAYLGEAGASHRVVWSRIERGTLFASEVNYGPWYWDLYGPPVGSLGMRVIKSGEGQDRDDVIRQVEQFLLGS